jgi:hypothetical protein
MGNYSLINNLKLVFFFNLRPMIIIMWHFKFKKYFLNEACKCNFLLYNVANDVLNKSKF